MPIGHNPRPARERPPMPSKKREPVPIKEPTLEELLLEAIENDDIRVNIPHLKHLYMSGPTKAKETFSDEIFYDLKCKFFHPKISDMAVLTSGGLNKNVYVRDNRDVIRDFNHPISPLGFSTSICYIDENGNPQLTGKDEWWLRTFILQPVFSFKDCPKLFNLLTHDGKDEYIYFGEAPIYAAPAAMQDVLTGAFKNNDVDRILGDYYTYDGAPVYGRNTKNKKFHEVNYPVYAYDGKHYIRYKITQLNKDLYSLGINLSNNKIYKNGDYIWIEVSPLLCKVNKEELALVCEEGIMGGIQYATPKTYSGQSYASYFVANYLRSNLLKNPKNYLYKKYEKEIKQEEPDEISKIIYEIKKYKQYYYGKENIDEKVRQLLNEYNKKLDEIEKNANSPHPMLIVGEFSPSLLHKTLLLHLNDVLNILKEYYEKNKYYFNVIEILEMCETENIDPTKDAICENIYNIKNSFIASLKNKEIKDNINNQLNSILDEYIREISIYIAKGFNSPGIIDELKNRLTFDIERWKEDSLIKALFADAKEDSVKLLLNDIKTAHDEIIENGSKEDIKLSEEYMTALKNVNINGLLPMVLKNLKNILIPLHKINYTIKERKTAQENINKYRPKVDVNTIFDDQGQRYTSMR